MSDQVAAFNGKIMTRREVEIAREAFDAGALWMFSAGDPWGVGGNPQTCRANARRSAARERFPLPKVTRPREVVDLDGDYWRWTPEKGLEYSGMKRIHWYSPQVGHINAQSRVAVADVLANPTEEVEAEE